MVMHVGNRMSIDVDVCMLQKFKSNAKQTKSTPENSLWSTPAFCPAGPAAAPCTKEVGTADCEFNGAAFVREYLHLPILPAQRNQIMCIERLMKVRCWLPEVNTTFQPSAEYTTGLIMTRNSSLRWGGRGYSGLAPRILW